MVFITARMVWTLAVSPPLGMASADRAHTVDTIRAGTVQGDSWKGKVSIKIAIYSLHSYKHVLLTIHIALGYVDSLSHRSLPE